MREIGAVVLWHELNHINFGKTYFDAALPKLNGYDLQTLLTAIMTELHKRQSRHQNPAHLSPPNFYQIIIVDEKGKSKLNLENLKQALPNITTDTLLGMRKQINLCLQNREKAKKDNNDDLVEDWKPIAKL